MIERFGMRNLIKLAPFVLLILMVIPLAAVAQTQITIGGGTSGTIVFSGGTETQISFVGSCGQSNCVSGNAYFGTDVGTYQMWISGANPSITAGTTPNIYAVNMNGGTLNFSFVVGGSTLTGTIQLAQVSNTSSPQFIGTMTVTASSGIFAALFSAGNVVPLDFTVALGSGSASVGTVLSGGAGSSSGTLSSGEILPAPEPASIALIGSGLLAVGAVVKKRLRKR